MTRYAPAGLTLVTNTVKPASVAIAAPVDPQRLFALARLQVRENKLFSFHADVTIKLLVMHEAVFVKITNALAALLGLILSVGNVTIGLAFLQGFKIFSRAWISTVRVFMGMWFTPNNMTIELNPRVVRS
jgi:hypothetical protein